MPAKRDVASGLVVDRLKISVAPVEPSAESLTASLDNESRRNFLRRSGTVAGGVLVGGALAGGASLAAAAPLSIPESNQGFGKPIPENDYGMPSKFEAHVRRRRTDVLKNRQNFSDWSMTPLQDQYGIITPNGLFFERHHNGTPDIDPAKHKLVIHGLVRQPLEFSMNDLLRYPSVSRFHFLECSGNGLTDWLKPASTTVQQTHGLLSCAQWTGIPVSWLLDEAQLLPEAKWLLFEGADGSGHTRSIPLKKVLDDSLIVYAQNGEMLRPEQGYPLRLLVPGWEGNVSVKWLRRIKVGDQPWNFRSETARYTDPMPDGMWRQFSFEMECKSVVTRPSGGMTIRPGMHEIQGFAWSGNGTIRAVDVTVDGGATWQEARLDAPVLDKCLTSFRFPWNWNGGPATIASPRRSSTGYVQPTVRDLAKVRAIAGFVQHNTASCRGHISAGEVKNAIG
jgi:sulfane dehydrogenase subunit SoxC